MFQKITAAKKNPIPHPCQPVMIWYAFLSLCFVYETLSYD